MSLIKTPTKPFAGYKWRWAVLTPTESLNEPPVFLGVLRVFNKYNNSPPSSVEILTALKKVQDETSSSVDLVRTQERNLVRNSGQYWTALGLLEKSHGRIQVSHFGRLLAEGKITQTEFAATVINTLELPNRKIIDDTSDWDNAGLKIKPLQLILTILVSISETINVDEAYITPDELVKIIIPLAGSKAPLDVYVDAIRQYRKKRIDISEWPDCAPNSNDKRMAREFLLFLCNYGFCSKKNIEDGNENERYTLASISNDEICELKKLESIDSDYGEVVQQIRITQIPANIERKRVLREVLERPYQNIFRESVLKNFNSTCIVTGVSIENVLEAAHIKPVKYNGEDSCQNGLCLRSDIHQLFDSNNLRIYPSGEIILSEVASKHNNYAYLPKNIPVPNFVNREYLEWRVNYY